MKKISYFFITVCFLNLNTLAQANIVDELTKLNNLYKEGALNQDEFDKAKKIILKTGSEENREIEPKQIIEIKKPVTKKDKTIDLTKTYIDKEELEIIGRYEKINKYPEGLFKNPRLSSSMRAEKATQEMYKTFVQNKNLQEKYPENMMKAMAYFEFFYNQKFEKWVNQ